MSDASSIEARARAQGIGALAPDGRLAGGAGEGFLAVHNLGKTYGARAVVQDVSLSVRRGEAVGLLGPNGAGKTTVFYMITGLVRPDKGVIELDGFPVTTLPMYQRARLGIGYLPQEASIFRGLNVEDNIRAVLEVNEPDRKAREATLNSLLEEFDIARLRKAPSIALSGGERRRCEIARALAGKPSFMLLDEPFAGIDPIAVGDIQDLVRHLKGRGIGVLITDHNVRETLGLIDRAYIIHSGHVLTEGPPEAIVAHPGRSPILSGRRLPHVASRRAISALSFRGARHSSSSKRFATSVSSASSASTACAPRAETVIVEPRPAPSIKMPMIEFAADGFAAARDLDLRVEAIDALHELGGGARVQSLAIDDAHVPRMRAGVDRGRRTVFVFATVASSRSFSRQHLARHGDVFAPGVARLDHRVIEVRGLAKRRQFDQHRQVDAANDLDAAAVHDGNGEVGRRAAEHVGQQDDAAAVLNARDRAENVGAPLLHVVFGADRDRLESRLRPDDMLERGAKTSGELAVGHKDHSNHQQSIVSGAAAAPANGPISQESAFLCSAAQ